eukprot:1138003-Pelagomonas_calceolata.AAC.1
MQNSIPLGYHEYVEDQTDSILCELCKAFSGTRRPEALLLLIHSGTSYHDDILGGYRVHFHQPG